MIETERLILEPLTTSEADIDGQFDVLRDPEVSKLVGIFKQPLTRQQAEWWCGIAKDSHAKQKGLRCAAFKRTGAGQGHEPKPIGYIGTAYTQEARAGEDWEVGYWIAKKDWGKGYVPEGLKAVMAQAMQGLGARKFFAELAIANGNSARVVEKCGFTRVAEFLKDTPGDKDRPSYLYEKPAVGP